MPRNLAHTLQLQSVERYSREHLFAIEDSTNLSQLRPGLVHPQFPSAASCIGIKEPGVVSRSQACQVLNIVEDPTMVMVSGEVPNAVPVHGISQRRENPTFARVITVQRLFSESPRLYTIRCFWHCNGSGSGSCGSGWLNGSPWYCHCRFYFSKSMKTRRDVNEVEIHARP